MHLELSQVTMITRCTANTSPSWPLAICGAPYGASGLILGPSQLCIFAPQPPDKQVLRLLKKGDFLGALTLVRGVFAGGKPPAVWLQAVLGRAVVACMKRVWLLSTQMKSVGGLNEAYCCCM
jgi:hypothetical protein